MRLSHFCILASAILAPIMIAGCQKPAAPPVQNVLVVAAKSVPDGPEDSAWQAAPVYAAKMIPQDLVEPRQMVPSTSEVRVRAIHNDSEIAFRLEWDDATQNDLGDQDHFC